MKRLGFFLLFIILLVGGLLAAEVPSSGTSYGDYKFGDITINVVFDKTAKTDVMTVYNKDQKVCSYAAKREILESFSDAHVLHFSKNPNRYIVTLWANPSLLHPEEIKVLDTAQLGKDCTFGTATQRGQTFAGGRVDWVLENDALIIKEFTAKDIDSTAETLKTTKCSLGNQANLQCYEGVATSYP
jgi:hypothetical protein